MSQSRHDAWAAGEAYDQYMGRWSRQLAPLFLDWLDAGRHARWLDVGCGTGALSAAILQSCDPRGVQGIDPSEGFVAQARANVADARASFRVGDAQAIDAPDASVEAAVSALAINFVPNKIKALAELARVTRPGWVAAFYVWDYPGGGVEFIRAFWTAASELDATAAGLTEDKRFPFCTRDGLLDLAKQAGWRNAESTALEAPSVFKDFDDFWRPFTLGAGPAPGYCASLDASARERLRARLSDTLKREKDGSTVMGLRAWAVKARI